MKGKVVLGLSLIAMAVCSTSNAMVIHKGKLLNHKEFTTGKAKSIFKEVKFDVKKELAKLKTKNLFLQNGNNNNNGNGNNGNNNNNNNNNNGNNNNGNNNNSFMDTVVAKDRMFDASGTTGYETEVSGVSHVFIANDTTDAQTYTIITAVCSMDYCGFNADQISLDPSGYAVSVKLA